MDASGPSGGRPVGPVPPCTRTRRGNEGAVLVGPSAAGVGAGSEDRTSDQAGRPSGHHALSGTPWQGLGIEGRSVGRRCMTGWPTGG
jgi:hypothetical protein